MVGCAAVEGAPPRGSEPTTLVAAAPSPPAALFAAEPQQGDPDRYYPESRRSESETPFGLDHVRLDAFFIPAFWITADEKVDTSFGSDRADLDTGTGFGLRAGVGSEHQSIGLMYVASFHEEETSDSDASTQALYLDFAYHNDVGGVRGATFEVGAGLGVAHLEFDREFDTETEGAFNLHGMLKFAVTDNFSVDAGLGGFVFGHFGDTVAYGTWLMVGASLAF
jgi:hypothetical protein